VAAEVAFDLVGAGERAVLVWAEPGGAVRVLPLDGGGAPVGEAHTVAPADRDGARARPANKNKAGRVVEVAAAATATALAVSWVREHGPELEAWGNVGELGELGFAKAVSLGAVSAGDRARRGHLAMTSEGDRLLVMHRGTAAPCRDDDAQSCTGFATDELGPGTVKKRGLPLSVPAACGVGVAAYAAAPGRWHYAVCSTAEGQAKTTLFNVQQDPNYAEAKVVLEGCTPNGSLMLNGNVILGGDCSGGRKVVRAGAMAKPLTTIDLASAQMTCSLGHPAIKAPDFELVLRQPLSGLSPLLPPDIAPVGARAVWTGVALIVARWVAGEVTLRRYECRAGELVRAG
jgi:hypothetical protein